jgi:hypothetical protein
MRAPVLVLLLTTGSLLARPAAAEIKIQQAGEQLSLRAVAAPLSEVLDRLAHQTGMKVLYEGAPPRQAVTVALERRTSAEVVFSLLEGLGLDYALRLDESGGHVMTLVLSGSARPPAPVVAQALPARPHMPDDNEEGVPVMPGAFQQAPEEAPLPAPDVNPPPPPRPQEKEALPQPGQFVGPSLGAGFSSPFSSNSFSGPSVFSTPAPPSQPVPAPQVDEPPPGFEPPDEVPR